MKLLAPAAVLTIICAVAALALAAVHSGTQPIIAQQERNFRLRSINQAIPAYDNHPDQDVVTIEHEGRRVCVFRGRQGQAITGVAFEWTQGGGYSGDIKVLVGFTPEGEVACNSSEEGDQRYVGLQILQHAETPGLGANMEEEGWRRQFCAHDLEDGDTFWRVRKDGGQVDSLTGATITTRVVSEAIVSALRFFQENREAILTGEPGTCEE
jgi:Na+-translocating ferredoxin:NAD+ oxidoreductase subunit G